MKRTIRILVLGLVLVLAAPAVKAQAIKTNVPLLLVGTPNVGMEFTVSQQFTTNLDILWMPYMFKKHEEVLRALGRQCRFAVLRQTALLLYQQYV